MEDFLGGYGKFLGHWDVARENLEGFKRNTSLYRFIALAKHH